MRRIGIDPRGMAERPSEMFTAPGYGELAGFRERVRRGSAAPIQGDLKITLLLS
jgi:hypothetical protein